MGNFLFDWNDPFVFMRGGRIKQRQDMSKEEFYFECGRVLKECENYHNLEPITSFFQRLVHCKTEELKDTVEYISMFEQGMLEKKILPFKVEHYDDIDRINPTCNIGKIQWFIWNLLHRAEMLR